MTSSAARRGLTADGLIAKANAEQLAGVIADKMRARCKPMGIQPWRKWVSAELSRMSPLLRSMVRAALEARAGK
ncbi:hypothetical protein MCB86_08920 [Pseudomonas sp. KSR10]|uniref:hypothetical protein n=1 Tax=Pseudomonas sp. KSR10 TaxID=2916654 RepID=UPI001EF87797|nr:hypothetical protein [Pseudomonas sp. KSR10]MCG6540195.1 hypothetical protein [Pseudomonas sp. KSR10]